MTKPPPADRPSRKGRKPLDANLVRAVVDMYAPADPSPQPKESPQP